MLKASSTKGKTSGDGINTLNDYILHEVPMNAIAIIQMILFEFVHQSLNSVGMVPFLEIPYNLCRRCSNYIFIPDLTPGFNRLRKYNCKMRQGTFKFCDLVRLILQVWRHNIFEMKEIGRF